MQEGSVDNELMIESSSQRLEGTVIHFEDHLNCIDYSNMDEMSIQTYFNSVINTFTAAEE